MQLNITPDGIEYRPYVEVRIPFHCKNFFDRARVCGDLGFYCDHKSISYRIRHHNGGRSVLVAEGTRDQVDALLRYVGVGSPVLESSPLYQPAAA